MTSKIPDRGYSSSQEAPKKRGTTRSPLTNRDWAEMLRQSVNEHYDALGPALVSSAGRLEVQCAGKGENVPERPAISNVSGALFVSSTEEGGKVDLFALVRPDRKLRISVPTYIATFSITSPHIQATENYQKLRCRCP